MSLNSNHQLLVVDDEPDLRTLYELTLVREGYGVETAATVEDAWERLLTKSYDVVITDLRLPDGTGLDLIRRLENAKRAEKSVVITAYGSAENAVEALKAGAYDYLTKPVDLKQFRNVIASALGRASTGGAVMPSSASGVANGKAWDAPNMKDKPLSVASSSAPTSTTADPVIDSVSETLNRMVGGSGAMADVRQLIAKVARSMAPVLIHGESGTGKELVARSIHEVSPRASRPFIPVNCGAIPEHLLEAEFFGYRKGAFTGAMEDREGFFQAASGGTLFLDEIGDLPLAMQSKLLRVIQERAVRPVGATAEIPVNARILSATHKDLAQEVQAGRFRQDLFYRLNVIQIKIPALRERLQDLDVISASLLDRIAKEAGVEPMTLSSGALQRLQRYEFPGNVRELENLLHRAVALANDTAIQADDLGLPDELLGEYEEERQPALSENGSLDDDAFGSASSLTRSASPSSSDFLKLESLPGHQVLPSDLVGYLDSVEKELLQRALKIHRFNRTAAGTALGLSLRQMRYRMARLNIHGPDDASDSKGEA